MPSKRKLSYTWNVEVADEELMIHKPESPVFYDMEVQRNRAAERKQGRMLSKYTNSMPYLEKLKKDLKS